jgi:threonine dehydratase
VSSSPPTAGPAETAFGTSSAPVAADGLAGGVAAAAALDLPTPTDVVLAAARLAGHVRATPVETSRGLDALFGARVFWKCENLQRVGAFKARGATNAVLGLADAEARAGVVTHSSGNHGAALALAARTRGIPCWVVMPETALRPKLEAVRGYGAEVVLCAPTQAAREQAAAAIVATHGATFVHPYETPAVIAGQGTAALELLAATGGLDAVLVPVGGGGLASGTCLAVEAWWSGLAGARPALSARPQVVGGEPLLADDAARSLATGVRQPQVLPARSLADGLLTALGPRTFALLTAHRPQILTVDEAAIVAAMRLVWERLKLVIEPSAAVPVAALLTRRAEIPGERIGVILSGGNVDLDRLPFAPA